MLLRAPPSSHPHPCGVDFTRSVTGVCTNDNLGAHPKQLPRLACFLPAQALAGPLFLLKFGLPQGTLSKCLKANRNSSAEIPPYLASHPLGGQAAVVTQGSGILHFLPKTSGRLLKTGQTSRKLLHFKLPRTKILPAPELPKNCTRAGAQIWGTEGNHGKLGGGSTNPKPHPSPRHPCPPSRRRPPCYRPRPPPPPREPRPP